MKVERLILGTLDDATGFTLLVEALLLVMFGVVPVRTEAETRAQKRCFAVIFLGQGLADARFHKRLVPRRRNGIVLGLGVQPTFHFAKAIVALAYLTHCLQACVTLA